MNMIGVFYRLCRLVSIFVVQILSNASDQNNYAEKRQHQDNEMNKILINSYPQAMPVAPVWAAIKVSAT